LIGLLFVALSVAPERVLGPDASEVHTVRAHQLPGRFGRRVRDRAARDTPK
jgi:hypothetical protein